MSFHDEQNYLHAQPNVFNAENAIEFTIINAILNNENVLLQVYDYLLNCSRDKVNTKYKLTHDDLTTCYAYLNSIEDGFDVLMKISGVSGIKNLSASCRQKRKELNSYHPREWAYYNLLEGKGFKSLNYFLLSIVMIWSCFFKYGNFVHGHKDGDSKKLSSVKRYLMKTIPFVNFDGYIKGKEVVVSGKILCWLRFKSGINMPITKKVCDYLIKRNFDSWKEIFAVYFVGNHPILEHDTKEFDLWNY